MLPALKIMSCIPIPSIHDDVDIHKCRLIHMQNLFSNQKTREKKHDGKEKI